MITDTLHHTINKGNACCIALSFVKSFDNFTLKCPRNRGRAHFDGFNRDYRLLKQLHNTILQI